MEAAPFGKVFWTISDAERVRKHKPSQQVQQPAASTTANAEVDDDALNLPTTVRSSSPLASGPRLSIQEFVDKYKLLPDAAKFLINLQFTPGNSLRDEDVLREDWQEAGFKVVLWRQTQKANKAYRAKLELDM